MKRIIKIVLIGIIAFVFTGCKTEEEKQQKEMLKLKQEIEAKKKKYYNLEKKTQKKGEVPSLSVLMKRSIENGKKSRLRQRKKDYLNNKPNIKEKQ